MLELRRADLTPYETEWLDARLAFEAGDWEAWVGGLGRAAELAPGSKVVYNYALAFSQWFKRPHQALQILTTLEPDKGAMRGWGSYWVVLAGLYNDAGEPERALEVIRRGGQQYSYAAAREWRYLAASGRIDELTSALDTLSAYARVGAVHRLRIHDFDDSQR